MEQHKQNGTTVLSWFDRLAHVYLLILDVLDYVPTKVYLHQSTSKKAHRRMIMTGQPVQFPQTRVFRSAVQGISLMGFISLASLSTTELGSSRWVLRCVNMECARSTSTGWKLLSQRVIVVFLVRRNVDEMLFVIFLLNVNEKFKLRYVSENKDYSLFIPDYRPL